MYPIGDWSALLKRGPIQLKQRVGSFDGDVGLFYFEDTDDGRPIKVVYKWTKVGPNGERWEQAFSYVDGRTWETNWVNGHGRVKKLRKSGMVVAGVAVV